MILPPAAFAFLASLLPPVAMGAATGGGAPHDGMAPCSLVPPPHAIAEAALGQGGQFGAAVAIASDPRGGGAFCAMGAPNAMSSGSRRGSVRLVVLDGQDGSMRPCSRIGQGTVAPAGLSGHARFGAALDLVGAGGGCLLAVGAPGANSGGGSRAGLVRLYRAVPSGAGPIPMTELVELSPAAANDGAAFGAAVAIHPAGDKVAIGAPFASESGGPSFTGAVYVYGSALGEWSLQFVVTPPRPSVAATFGHAVAWVGGTLVVGAPGDGEVAPGAGRVYGVAGEGPDRGAFRWEVEPPARAGSAAGMRFGESLAAIDSTTLAIGGWGRGVVEVVSVRASVAPIHRALVQGNPAEGFGLRLAATAERLFVAAPFAQGPGGQPSAGRVDAYRRLGEDWVFDAGHHSLSSSANGEFGVAIDACTSVSGGHHVIAGEPGSHVACPRGKSCAAGAAFVF